MFVAMVSRLKRKEDQEKKLKEMMDKIASGQHDWKVRLDQGGQAIEGCLTIHNHSIWMVVRVA